MVGKGRPKNLARHVKTNRAFRAYIDLMDAADWLRGEMSDQLASFDLTMTQFRVLGSAWKRSTLEATLLKDEYTLCTTRRRPSHVRKATVFPAKRSSLPVRSRVP